MLFLRITVVESLLIRGLQNSSARTCESNKEVFSDLGLQVSNTSRSDTRRFLVQSGRPASILLNLLGSYLNFAIGYSLIGLVPSKPSYCYPARQCVQYSLRWSGLGGAELYPTPHFVPEGISSSLRDLIVLVFNIEVGIVSVITCKLAINL